MRPAGRSELDSLYFDYPQFAAPIRDEEFAREAPVAIIGAGPVGLVAALTLAAFGVRSIVIERKSTFNDGSRAICISRSSYHILDRLDAVAPFLEKSLGWTTGRSFFHGKQFLEFQMPHSAHEKFMPMYNLQQQYIEKFLYDSAARTGLIDIRWRSEAKNIRAAADHIEIDIEDPDGVYVLTADWMLAADGARSAVRAMRGLRLKGENFEGRYVIVDVRMEHDYPTIRRALFDPESNPGGTVLIHRQPDNIWRIDYQLRQDESAELATREETVRARIASILRDIGHDGEWDLEWWSVYAANTLLLDDYRDGRIFFIGDAAHIVPIFGVRGLNNGIADAENIGWKLAKVIKGEARETLLGSYTPERRGATLDVFANAVKSTRFMTPPTYGWTLMRDAALSLSLSQPFAGRFANPRQMTPYDYAESPMTELSEAPAVGATAGAVLPGVRLTDGGFLCDRLGRGFSAIWFGGVEKRATLQTALEAVDPDAKAIFIGEGGDIPDPEGEIAARLGAGAGDSFLVRPDLYLAGRWRGGDDGPVVALARILGTPGDPA